MTYAGNNLNNDIAVRVRSAQAAPFALNEDAVINSIVLTIVVV